MYYAYDASKILSDYPDEAKHLYSLLPRKRVTTNFTRKPSPPPPPRSLPKKEEIIHRVNRIEVALIEIKLSECAQPIVATISQTDIVEEKKEEKLKAAPRRRRVVKSSKIKDKSEVKKPDVEVKQETIIPTTAKPVTNIVPTKPLTIETPPQTHNDPIVSKSEADVEINKFTSLNDDCLISLFSFCDKLDLVNLAMVCERFRFIVYNYLKAKMSKIVDLNKIKSTGKLTIREAIKFLKFIDAAEHTQELALTMSGFDESTDQIIIDTILKRCGPNLNCLKFEGFSFSEAFTNQWRQLLAGLTTLIFHQCVLPGNHFGALLKICKNLNILNLTNSNSTNTSADDSVKPDLTDCTCANLKEFRLTSSRNCGRSSELTWLLENNPNLIILQMANVGDSIKLAGEVLKSIGRCQELQDLAFSFQNFDYDLTENLPHLIRLKELKTLSLQCDWMNISKFFRQFSQAPATKQIERLSFECVDIDTSFMRSIGRLRKLKYLKLENTIVNEPSQEVFEQSLLDLTYRLNNLGRFDCQLHLFTEDTLVQFVERMKRLEHFQVSGLVMNLFLFMRIVSACGRRTNGIKLNIIIDNYQYLNEYLDLVSETRRQYTNGMIQRKIFFGFRLKVNMEMLLVCSRCTIRLR